MQTFILQACSGPSRLRPPGIEARSADLLL